jgi:glutaredoxin-like protein
MTDSMIIVYGTEWCFDCRRTRQFLNQHQVPYEWVNIDKDREGEQYVKKVNKGMRSVPTILFPDGSILVEPSNNELAQQLTKHTGNIILR